MRSAFIVGCGYTGAALASRLAAAGCSVAALDHDDGKAPGPSVAVQRADLLAAGPLELSLPPGATVYYTVPPLFRSYDPAVRPHLAPMQRVLEPLGTAGIARLVYLSATSVYGDRGGDWVDEATPPRPDSPWGQMRVELEQLVWRFGAEAGVPVTVLRLPEIYGPRRGPVERLRRGHSIRHPDRWTNRIHLEDLVEVLQELGSRTTAPELMLCSDDEPARAEEVYAFAARLLGAERLQAGAGDAPPADANRLALGRDSKRCRNTRLRAWLGRALRYPSYRDGLPAAL